MKTTCFLLFLTCAVNIVFPSHAETMLPKSSNKHSLFQLQADVKRSIITVEHTWTPTENEIVQLLNSEINGSISLHRFPDTFKSTTNLNNQIGTIHLDLQRYRIFSQQAKVIIINQESMLIKPTPDLLVYRSKEAGVSLVIDPQNRDVSGLISRYGMSMAIEGNLNTGIHFKNLDTITPTDHSSQQCLTAMADQPGNPFADLNIDLKSRSLAKRLEGAIEYETTIAVDTDNEWMAGKNNNPTTAMSYIVSLFSNMNVYFERDLSLRLLIGDVTLRVATDPYPSRTDAFDSLNDFGEYWRVNNDNINRDFTVLISGQNIGAFSFSGIAWVNQYCEQGFLQAGGTQTVGSYSVNRMGASLAASFGAQFLGHELGHNLGSPHTHCYPTPVDECYNAESGCFAGTVSCPAGGSGTIMSYCHVGSPNGADCGNNGQQFHPTVTSLIDTRMFANAPACIQPLGSDIIFANSFE